MQPRGGGQINWLDSSSLSDASDAMKSPAFTSYTIYSITHFDLGSTEHHGIMDCSENDFRYSNSYTLNRARKPQGWIIDYCEVGESNQVS